MQLYNERERERDLNQWLKSHQVCSPKSLVHLVAISAGYIIVPVGGKKSPTVLSEPLNHCFEWVIESFLTESIIILS